MYLMQSMLQLPGRILQKNLLWQRGIYSLKYIPPRPRFARPLLLKNRCGSNGGGESNSQMRLT